MSEVSLQGLQYYFHTHLDNVHEGLDHHMYCLQGVLMVAVVEEDGNADDLDRGAGEDLQEKL